MNIWLDLAISFLLIIAGLAGLISTRFMAKRFDEFNAICRMTPHRLHIELTRCVGAIIVCAEKGDRRAVRYARRRIRLYSKALIVSKNRQREAARLRRIRRHIYFTPVPHGATIAKGVTTI